MSDWTDVVLDIRLESSSRKLTQIIKLICCWKVVDVGKY